MKIIKILGIILALVIVLGLVLMFTLPTKYQVARTKTIETDSAELVFKNLSHFKEFVKWSPWSELDPNQTASFFGNDGEVGSNYKWQGNKDVGKGEMRLTEVVKNEYIKEDLHFIEPWEATSKVSMSMKKVDKGYDVTWTMDSEMPAPMNVFGLFMNMEKAIGSDFEKGLSKLNEKVKKEDR